MPACSRFGVVTFSTQIKGCLMAPRDFNLQVGRIFSWLVNLYPPPLPPPKKGGFNSRSCYISLSTKTKRSCLGGFGGAAGSDTSRYDFCHDQKQTHMSQNDIRLQRCHPPPFWRKSHLVGLVVLVCFELNVLT